MIGLLKLTNHILTNPAKPESTSATKSDCGNLIKIPCSLVLSRVDELVGVPKSTLDLRHCGHQKPTTRTPTAPLVPFC